MQKIILFALLFPLSALAVGEAGGARTWKVDSYTKDRNHDQAGTYKFGIFEDIYKANVEPPLLRYEDPVFVDALAYASPLHEARFSSYDIIIVVNLFTEKPSPENQNQKLEVAQRLRLYIRPEAMDYIGWDRFHMNNAYDPEIGLLYHWKVSSAKSNTGTPTGHFPVESFSSNNKSANYNGAPMPWAVFFRNGLYATHGTNAIELLGTQQSHGCIRLETQRARDLFHLIGAAGEGEVDIINRDGSLKTLVDGSPDRKTGYKTLFVIK